MDCPLTLQRMAIRSHFTCHSDLLSDCLESCADHLGILSRFRRKNIKVEYRCLPCRRKRKMVASVLCTVFMDHPEQPPCLLSKNKFATALSAWWVSVMADRWVNWKPPRFFCFFKTKCPCTVCLSQTRQEDGGDTCHGVPSACL